MAKSRQELIDRFSERYSIRGSAALEEIERTVIGGVFGANGYTTKAQVDRLIDKLDLQSTSQVLDLGAGRGWPGLYIAEATGCNVVLADIPEPGLRVALQRANERKIADRAHPLMAAAERMPLRPRSFDAVVHTDVL
jgi:ubiquinone/menaquinone biosynthesis C-methylase UbiE